MTQKEARTHMNTKCFCSIFPTTTSPHSQAGYAPYLGSIIQGSLPSQCFFLLQIMRPCFLPLST